MNSKLYVYPTDTVWGIGGNIFSEECYIKISKIKGHGSEKPLSIVFRDYEMISALLDLPDIFTKKWLDYLFTLEATICLPKEWARTLLPKWICQSSMYISIRCLNTPELFPIFEEVGGPITSTSLNISGQEPIKNIQDAREFFNLYMNEDYFSDKLETECSGRSSTIILYHSSGFKIAREGKYIEEIKEHIKILST